MTASMERFTFLMNRTASLLLRPNKPACFNQLRLTGPRITRIIGSMRLRFVEKEPEVSGVYSFLFEPDLPVGQAGKKISWQPGQYLHYELPHPDADDRGIERWFTISAPPYEGLPTITTRFDHEHSSSFKNALRKLEPGTEIEAGEPRGDFLLDPDASRHVLIAGGIGITPYYSQ